MGPINLNYPELDVPSSNQNRRKPFRADRRLKLAFSAIMVLTFMVAMNSTALSVAIPAVAADLDGTALESFWAGTAFLLTEAVFMVPMGRTSDVVGRLPVLNPSTGLFLVGTIISSVAPSMAVLVFGRAVQGAGSGGVAVLLEIIVTDLVPLHVRGNYFSLISALWTFGDAVGPILGGPLYSVVATLSLKSVQRSKPGRCEVGVGKDGGSSDEVIPSQLLPPSSSETRQHC